MGLSSLGPGHYDATLADPLKAAEAYREQACLHQRTAELCAAQGIKYEPMVFTCQGGCEGHAEAILSQIATSVAKVEGAAAATVKAELLEEISLCIRRSVARAVARRAPAARRGKICAIRRALEEAAADCMESED